ncbi:hypothetical protein PMG11_07291 [Penicillium brasilianum]|uniref:Uncharacterized protein n=1 Tax=Penicillium brasilianum TaxID=104259 RepID=A0A0F7TS64_PENBI|nr:hypothetical protein PMG11_07291 [Penicillium brasilianum]
MRTNPPPFAPVTKPPRAIVALALAIVKNKPAGTSVKDYILDLRKSIRKSEASKPILTNLFFDSVEHWQRAYRKAEGEQIKLHNTIFELKQQNEALVSKINAATPPAKRKAFSDAENEPEIGRKRQKTRNLRTQSQLDIASQDQDANHEQETQQGISFLRRIFTLQRTLQAKRRKTKTLAVDAVIACKEAEQGLLTAIHAEVTPPAPPKPFRSLKDKNKGPNFVAVVNAVELTFKLVHQALHKIPEAADDGQSQPKVVYYLVCIFESTMTGLAQYCTAASKESTAGNGPTGTTRAKPQLKKKAGLWARGKTSAKQDTAQVLVDLLCKMALSLDLGQSCDQQVMEGFLHTVLDRLGKMLALFTFNDIQLPTNLNAGLRPPEGLTAMREADMSRETAQLEAEKLISFLDRVLKDETLFPLAGPASSGQPHFNLKVQVAMKKTLLQAVFGKEDPLFQGGLERPETPPPADCWAPPNLRLDFTEWFAGELWRLIGWEILDPTRVSHP